MLRFYRVQVQSISTAGAKVQRRRGSAEVVVSRGAEQVQSMVQSRYKVQSRSRNRSRGAGAETRCSNTGAAVQVHMSEVQRCRECRGAEVQRWRCCVAASE